VINNNKGREPKMMWEFRDLEKIRQLLVHGRYNEALQNIILYKRKMKLSVEEEIKAELLHIEILFRAGFLQDIAPKLDFLSKNSELANNMELYLEWMVLNARYNQEIGKLASAKPFLKQAHEIVLTSFQPKSAKVEKLTKEEKSTKENIIDNFANQKESKNQISPLPFIFQKILFLEGIQHWYEGNIEEALQKLEDVLQIIPKNSHSGQYIQILTYYGMILCENGDYTRGISHLQHALELERDLGDKVALAQILGQLGRITHLQGHLDEALKYLQESIFIWENLGDFSQIRFNLADIGTIYRQKGDYHQALNYIKRSLVIAERIGNPNELSRFLLELIRIYLEMNAIENAEIALARLFQLQTMISNKKIELRYRLANALILKQKGRARNLFQAQSLFTSITEEPLVEEEITQIALLNLCELLLVELRLNDDASLYEELEKVIEKLQNEAEKQGSHLLYAETYLLKAKLLLLRLNISEARHCLNQAQTYAEQSGLLRVAMKISEEHDKLVAQQQIWNSYQLSEVPLQKRAELAEIENYMRNIVHEKGFDTPQMINEIPVAFILLNLKGTVLYFKVFTSYWNFDKDMLAGFLSAFDMMSDEVFSQTLERAKFGNFNVIVQKIQSFMLGYVYQGPSFFAQKKMQTLGQEFTENKVLLEELDNLTESKDSLESVNFKDGLIPVETVNSTKNDMQKTPSYIKYLNELCECILIPEYSNPAKKATLPENS